MKSEFNSSRSTGERVLIGVLIVTTTAVLIGIQSLFLNHIAPALPADPIWNFVVILCFLAPPISFALMVLLKMNYSRSPAQDWILICGMLLELLLFVVNLIVAVNAHAIENTMLGVMGLLLGGVAGVVGAGTVALCLAADPLRGITKQRVMHDLQVQDQLQKKAAGHLFEQMDSPNVIARAAADAERFVIDEYGRIFGRLPGAAKPKPPASPDAPPQNTRSELTPDQLAQILALLKAGETKPNGGVYPNAPPPSNNPPTDPKA